MQREVPAVFGKDPMDEISFMLRDKGGPTAHLSRLTEVSEKMQSLEFALIRRSAVRVSAPRTASAVSAGKDSSSL